MGLQLLIVDDDLQGLLALSDALRRRLRNDIFIETAPNGYTGLARLQAKHFDILICDIRMPGMDGVQVLREVKAHWPSMPVILFTAEGREKEEAALYAGAYAFVEKPLDVDHLFSIIEAALQRNDLAKRIRKENETSLLNRRLKFPELMPPDDPSKS
jgi:DNA-binding NtrC family response regulator